MISQVCTSQNVRPDAVASNTKTTLRHGNNIQFQNRIKYKIFDSSQGLGPGWPAFYPVFYISEN